MTADEFAAALDLVLAALAEVARGDWSAPAATSEWSCRTTLDHTVDCVFSYALQLASRSAGGFLPFTELHARPDAEPADIVDGLRAVGAMFVAVVRATPADVTASDGLVAMDADGWCARAAYELLLHGHDVVRGLGGRLAPPPALCESVLASTDLWMLDRRRATGKDPWTDLLVGSGRPGP